ncbi:MAG TPA: hypothetical protein VHE55_11305 [Fimbriimonadaceae bacterium]|nr:hypothetical protein [Fimbriimonadaceae bacterium]
MKSVLRSLLYAALALPLAAYGQSLEKPFTLVYRVVDRDVRSQAVIDADIAEMASDYSDAVKRGTMTQEQVDDIVTNLKRGAERNPRTTKEVVTISFDGNRLLVRKLSDNPDEDEAKNARVTILSKAGVFARVGPDSSQFVRHITSQGLQNVPIVGPSMPFMPVKGAKGILSIAAFAPDRLVYEKGKVEDHIVEGAPKVSEIDYLGPRGEVTQSYRFKSHASLEGQWVGQDIAYTSYRYGKGSPAKGEPNRVKDFTLVEADAKALPPDEFELSHYLKDGESVNVTKTDGNQIVVTFHPQRGDLDRQVKETELSYDIALTRSKRSTASALPAGIATGLLLIGGAYCYIQDRRRSPTAD